jgi:hypothetical protein
MFAWDDDAAATFEALKSALTTGPVLQMLDFATTFVVDCDTSSAGFGAVLHQGVGSLAYFSRPFAGCHLKLLGIRPTVNTALIPFCHAQFSKEDQALVIHVPRKSTHTTIE